jgi:hypothetical protein
MRMEVEEVGERLVGRVDEWMGEEDVAFGRWADYYVPAK